MTDLPDFSLTTPLKVNELDSDLASRLQTLAVSNKRVLKPKKPSQSSFIPKLNRTTSIIVRRNKVIPKISTYDSEFISLVMEAKEPERYSPSHSRQSLPYQLETAVRVPEFSLDDSIEKVSRISLKKCNTASRVNDAASTNQ